MKTDIIISELKRGDKLFSTIHGEVEVVEIYSNTLYPIETADKNGRLRTFTSDGSYYGSDSIAALFKYNPFLQKERVILVIGYGSRGFVKRVLLTVKDCKAICWIEAETIEESKTVYTTSTWEYWKEVDETPKVIELTFQDISDGKGVGIDPKLIKIIL